MLLFVISLFEAITSSSMQLLVTTLLKYYPPLNKQTGPSGRFRYWLLTRFPPKEVERPTQSARIVASTVYNLAYPNPKVNIIFVLFFPIDRCPSFSTLNVAQTRNGCPAVDRAPVLSSKVLCAYGVSLLIRVNQLASDVRVPPQVPNPARFGGSG